MAVIYSKTFSTTCSGDLLAQINADPLIGVVLEQIIDDGTSQLEFWFATALTVPQETQLDSVLSTFVCPIHNEISAYSTVINDTTSGPDILWSSTKIISSLAAQDELHELADVQITTPSTNDILLFDGIKWVNVPDFANTITSIGSVINPNGSWLGFSGTNSLDAATTITNAFQLLDTQTHANSVGYTNIVTVITNYIATLANVVILCDGLLTVTLPSAVGVEGKTYHIKNIGTSTVTINTSNGQTIDGSTGITIAKRYNSYKIISDGSNWFVI